jgi:hypothetical protein
VRLLVGFEVFLFVGAAVGLLVFPSEDLAVGDTDGIILRENVGSAVVRHGVG